MSAEGRPAGLEHRELLSGLVRMHVLLHAAQEEIYGTWMIEELASPAPSEPSYPMLHAMVRDGCLTVRSERHGRTVRKYYAATDKGREGMARERVRVLTREADGR